MGNWIKLNALNEPAHYCAMCLIICVFYINEQRLVELPQETNHATDQKANFQKLCQFHSVPIYIEQNTWREGVGVTLLEFL